jgi:DNA invertase Pin-like site-specific DNA recombinase
MFEMMGVFADFERSMIVARVRAGVARAKASGTKSGKAFGRPRTPVDLESESVKLWRLLGGLASTRSQPSSA